MILLYLATALCLLCLWCIFAYARMCRDDERLSAMAKECRDIPFRFEYRDTVHWEARDEQRMMVVEVSVDSSGWDQAMSRVFRRITTLTNPDFDY